MLLKWIKVGYALNLYRRLQQIVQRENTQNYDHLGLHLSYYL